MSLFSEIPASFFTVSQLNRSVRQLLENEMGQIWLSGEISNFTQPTSGHWYFTLKDDKAQIRCAMFRTTNRKVLFRPQHGQQVILRATITLYEPRGDYQLIVEQMHPAGDGQLQLKFEKLKQQLTAEGLFASHYKKPLPTPAKCVGIITSSTGAALHDILNILKRRDPSLPVIIYPTQVQGAEAIEKIAATIELANLRHECDVLIVGRGGGSLEDLWCFNEERVARAIFASQIPIISAVGHETDVTIADFVADLRAPTPSAAAELVSRDRDEMQQRLTYQQQRLTMAMDYYFSRRLQQITTLANRLQKQHPESQLAIKNTLLVRLNQRLHQAMSTKLLLAERRHQRLKETLYQTAPTQRIHHYHQQLTALNYRLSQATQEQLHQAKHRFAVSCSQLNAVSPLATISRGYSVTTTTEGQLLKQAKQVAVGEPIVTRISDATLISRVETVEQL